MFTSYEMTTALVNERQATLRHEARQHRLGRSIRRGRTEVRPARSLSQADRLPAVPHDLPECMAA